MKTALRESTAKDSTKTRRNLALPRQRVVSPTEIGDTRIQRVSVCPCDGGCPRCASVIQPKLTISSPNDRYEQEADRIADEVMRMPEPKAQHQFEEEEQEELLQAKPIGDKITPLIQRQTETEEQKGLIQVKGEGESSQAIPDDIESSIQAMKGHGQPLPRPTRVYFEQRFDHDFSDVRIHADAAAAKVAKALNARALTSGWNVAFGSGQYAPKTIVGRELLAHELTHVSQQNSKAEKPCSRTCQQSQMSSDVNRNVSSPNGCEVQCQTVEGKASNHELNYGRAEILNKRYAHENYLGWETKLGQIKEGEFQTWNELWKAGKYSEFAEAVADFQQAKHFQKKDIDGVLGVKTWGAIAGLGEAIAGIKYVSSEAAKACVMATEARIERAYRILGKEPILPEDKDQDTYDIILNSIAEKMLKIEEKYRGTGAAGAIVYAGIGEFVAESEIWDGRLKPGAAVQVWRHKDDYDLLRAGEIEEDGKTRPLRSTSGVEEGGVHTFIEGDISSIYAGTSFVFVRYDPDTNERMLVRHKGKTEWKRKSKFDVWIAANIIE